LRTDALDESRRLDAAGARHVRYDDVGIARNILSDHRRERHWIGAYRARAHAGADIDRDGLAAIEVFDRLGYGRDVIEDQIRCAKNQSVCDRERFGGQSTAGTRARPAPSPRRGEAWGEGVTPSIAWFPLTPTLSPAEVGCFRLRPRH